MNEFELREALMERYRKQGEVARRAMDASIQAIKTVDRAEEASKKAHGESVAAQAAQHATRTAIEALGWEVPDDH